MPILTYKRTELLALREYDVAPARDTRKAIFSRRLWSPRAQHTAQRRKQLRCLGAHQDAHATEPCTLDVIAASENPVSRRLTNFTSETKTATLLQHRPSPHQN